MKVTDFLRSQAVTYTAKVLISLVNGARLRCCNNRSPTAVIVMTLSVTEGHSPLQAFSSGFFRILVARHAVPLQSTELLVPSANIP